MSTEATATRAGSTVRTKRRASWPYYFAGGAIYTALAAVLFVKGIWQVFAWVCAVSGPVGFWAALAAWKRDRK